MFFRLIAEKRQRNVSGEDTAEYEFSSPSRRLSGAGINYYIEAPSKEQNRWQGYWKQVLYFHQTPMVKMGFHFVS